MLRRTKNPSTQDEGEWRTSQSAVLAFDSDLELTSHLFQEGLQHQLSIFAATKDKIVFSNFSEAHNWRFPLYYVNMELKNAQYIHLSRPVNQGPTYHVDPDGVNYAIEFAGDSIELLKLN